MALASPPLTAWLVVDETADGAYRHSSIDEEPSGRSEGLAALRRIASEAHRDARARLERLIGVSLDPLAGDQPADWQPYPDALHTSVLQGYLGEMLAGVIAVNYEPHGRCWEVPAFLFRGHQAGYQALERRRQLGGPARPVPGRTGDDALAFGRDEDGTIIAWLWGEAKCTHDHDSKLVNAGHEQLSTAIRIPVDVVQLIDVLLESDDSEGQRWVSALRELLFSSDPPARYDMLVYVCGRKPQRKSTWIPRSAPHAKYTGPGPLHAVELRFSDFDEVLRAAYPKHVIDRG